VKFIGRPESGSLGLAILGHSPKKLRAQLVKNWKYGFCAIALNPSIAMKVAISISRLDAAGYGKYFCAQIIFPW